MRIDDRDVSFGNARPFMRGDRILVPLDTVARAANFDYRYDAARRTISARNGALSMGLGSRIAVLNGERRAMPVASETQGVTLFVPVQFIGLATGGSVGWDSVSRTVLLNTYR